MAQQPIDYKAVIGDLEQKRSQFNQRIDTAIAAIKHVMALDVGGHPIPQGLPQIQAASGIGPYSEMDMVPAALHHLGTAGRPVPNVLLAKALEEGGFRHRSRNFPNTLNSVLWRRHKTVGDIRKSARGWELAPRQ